MRRLSLALVATLIAAVGLTSTPAPADPMCYRLRVMHKGKVMIDRRVGLSCTPSAAVVSVSTQRVGDTVVETTRYLAR